MKQIYEDFWTDKVEQFSDLYPPAVARVQFIARLLPERRKLGRVIDVGCGNGTTLFLLKSNFEFSAYGVDISKTAVEVARQKGIESKTADITDRVPFNDKYFDVVICSEVLEHLVSPHKALSEIARVAKDDAIFIFSIPNIAYIGNRLRLLLGKTIFELPFSSEKHLRFWVKNSFARLLNAHGIRITKCIGSGGHTILNKLIKRDSLWSRYLFFRAVRSTYSK